MNFTNNLKEAEEFDNLKSKVLKYVLYKKRTENEVREKFKDIPQNKLEDIIDFLKEYNYINDTEYIEKSVDEFKKLQNLSLKEISYKLMRKGLNKNLIDDYIYSNKEVLFEYEINSARNILLKKIKNSELNDIKNFLYKKGYMSESVEIAINNLEL